MVDIEYIFERRVFCNTIKMKYQITCSVSIVKLPYVTWTQDMGHAVGCFFFRGWLEVVVTWR